MKSSLKISIFGLAVEVLSENSKLISNLKSDFSYFIVDDFKSSKRKFVLSIEKNDYQDKIPENLRASKQTENSIYYDYKGLRYNDYYGKALSITNFDQLVSDVYYKDETFIHELVYLIILSISGKFMDKNGYHKIHACGFNRDETNIIIMLPSKGGKTTLFCDVISDPNINIISDDTPVVNSKGKIYPFPLRIGSESELFLREKFPYISVDEIRNFKREHYSEKNLVSVSSLKNKIKASRKNILICGYRGTFDTPKITKIGTFKMVKNLMEHMVIGIGLPMIVEYFLRNNLKDHFYNILIFYSRLKSAFILANGSKKYEIVFSSDLNKNKEAVLKLFDER